MQEASDEPINYKETELKEDVLLVQFKLVEKDSYKTLNTFNFVNMPLSKVNDNNVATLIEIMTKMKRMAGRNKKQEFIPFRKSIMTRVLAEQIQRNNIIVLSHYSKMSIHHHLKNGSGPAKGLFTQIDTLFGDNGHLVKKKLNDAQAIKILQ